MTLANLNYSIKDKINVYKKKRTAILWKCKNRTAVRSLYKNHRILYIVFALPLIFLCINLIKKTFRLSIDFRHTMLLPYSQKYTIFCTFLQPKGILPKYLENLVKLPKNQYYY